MHVEQDKISYGLTIKVGLPNYGSADCHVSYSSSIKEDETPEKALKRVKAFVEKNLETKKKELIALSEQDDSVTVPDSEDTKTTKEKAPDKKKSGGLGRLRSAKKNADAKDDGEAKGDEDTVNVDEEEKAEASAKEESSSETEGAEDEDSTASKIAALKARFGVGKKTEGQTTSSLKR